jgi:hypothetical protein
LDGIAWREVADARNRRGGKAQKISRAWEFGHDEIFNMASISMRHGEVMQGLIFGASFAGIRPAKRSFNLLDADKLEGETYVPLKSVDVALCGISY